MRWVRIAAQIAGLVVIFRVASFLVEHFPLRVPANVLGMLILFGLLCSGLVREQWIGEGAGLLTRHLSFFFIPIVVGLMEWTGLLVASGARLLAVLVASSMVGLLATGRVVQLFARRQPRARAHARRAEAQS